jgi:hypothetical protein
MSNMTIKSEKFLYEAERSQKPALKYELKQTRLEDLPCSVVAAAHPVHSQQLYISRSRSLLSKPE